MIRQFNGNLFRTSLTDEVMVEDDADDTDEETDELTAVVVDAVTDVLDEGVPVVVAAAATPFVIVLNVVHSLVAGAGCASGVTGCPWKNVDVP